MLRYFAGAGSALLLIMAGFFIWTGIAQDESEDPVAEPPVESATPIPLRSGPPERPPTADERTKEQRRFDRSDRDKNGRVSLEELVYPRRRAFDRLDTNHDGRLSFEEWGVRTLEKFAEADSDRDRTLTRPEFATTAPRRRPVTRRQNCSC